MDDMTDIHSTTDHDGSQLIADTSAAAAAASASWMLPSTTTTLSLSSTTTTTTTIPSTTVIATLLGYGVGCLSFILYTPIGIRIWNQRHANGLSETTWWFKLASYTTTIVYNIHHGYPVSTYVETIIISIQSAIILGLVTKFQSQQSQSSQRTNDRRKTRSTTTTSTRAASATIASTTTSTISTGFQFKCILYVLLTVWGLTVAPSNIIAIGQFVAAGLNSAALLPQFVLNYKTQSKGDYSPVTAGLAAAGCAVRLFTTATLAGADIVLLSSFGLALVLNTALFSQIVYYGLVKEHLTLRQIFQSDIIPTTTSTNNETGGRTSSSSSSTMMSTSMSNKTKRKKKDDDHDDDDDEYPEDVENYSTTADTTTTNGSVDVESDMDDDDDDDNDGSNRSSSSGSSSSSLIQQENNASLLEMGTIKIRK